MAVYLARIKPIWPELSDKEAKRLLGSRIFILT